LEFNASGQILASAGADNTLVLWDINASKQLNVFTGHTGEVNAVTFHPTKNILASASNDSTVKLWSFPDGQVVANFNFFTNHVKDVCFSPDGLYLACASDSIYIINLSTLEIKTIKKRAKKLFTTVAISHNNKIISFGGKRHKRLYTYNFETLKPQKKYRTHSNQIIFTNNDRYIYSAGNLGNIKRMPVSQISLRKKINITSNHLWSSFYSVAVTDNYVAGANRDYLIYVYNPLSGKKMFTLKGHINEVKSLQFTHDGKFLASAGNDRRIIIWNMETREISKILYGGGKQIGTLSFSNDGNELFIGYKDGTLKVWNFTQKGEIITSKAPVSTIKQNRRWEYELLNSRNNFTDKIYVKAHFKQKDKLTERYYKHHDRLLIWDYKKTGLLAVNRNMKTLKMPGKIDYYSFDLTDSILVAYKFKSTHSQEKSWLNSDFEKPVELVFSTKYKILSKDKQLKKKKFKRIRKSVTKVSGDLVTRKASPSGAYIAFIFHENRNRNICIITNTNNNKTVSSFRVPKASAFIEISANDKYILIFDKVLNRLTQYALETGDSMFSVNGNLPVSYNETSENLLYLSGNNIVMINTINANVLFSVPSTHTSTITTLKFNSKFNYFATAANDGLVKLWNTQNGQLLLNLAAFNVTDFVYITPDNYYYSTRGAMDFIGFRVKENVYSFEQFDLAYNRPDLVLSKLSYTPPEDIEAYNKAYVKRLSKSGIPVENIGKEFHIPELLITNLSEIPFYTQSETLHVKVEAKDSLHIIDKINIWVNDIPVYGAMGYNTVKQDKHIINHEFNVKLSAGKNFIQISAINDKGAESLRKNFLIDYDITPKKPDLYLITIGISEYKNTEYNLTYAAKDATDLSSTFKKNKRKYKNIYDIQVLNDAANKQNISNLRQKLLYSNVDDVVILFFAGHGVLDSDMNYYLTTTETDLNDLAGTSISYENFERILDSIPARKRLIMIDACHSGEVDTEEEIVKVVTVTKEKDTRNINNNQVIKQENVSYISTFNLMKELFADIKKNTGSVVISSAGGNEFAYEGKKWNNGVFSYCVMEGLTTKKADINKDGNIMVSELRDYVSQQVNSLTKGKQNPTSRRDNLKFDFKIW